MAPNKKNAVPAVSVKAEKEADLVMEVCAFLLEGIRRM